MKQVCLEDLKHMQIRILDCVAEFCEKNDITYWLDSGTLLGAIRHDGYIPWDDDIDIGMLRPDFDRFIKEFNGYNSRYIVKCIETDLDFYYAFAKVLDDKTVLFEPDEKGVRININIDVFVYDNAPDEDKLYRKQIRKRDFYRNANLLRTLHHKPKGGLVRRIVVRGARLLVRPFPVNYFVKKLSENSKLYKDVNTKRVGNFTGTINFCCNRSVFDSFEYHMFEGKKYKIPVGYDEWLTSIFGDYLQLPSIEKRVSHHTFSAYLKDEYSETEDTTL